MRCPYCQRPVRPFGPLMKKALPYCGACRRYVLSQAHKLTLAIVALAALLALLTLSGML
jgi:hypothetical protein